MPTWYIYVVRCSDHSLYTGVSNDPPMKVAQLNAWMSSVHSRRKRATRLLFCERWPTKSAALRRQAAIRKLPKHLKEQLVLGRRGAQLSYSDGIDGRTHHVAGGDMMSD
jgi:putative endonuclease